MCAREGPTGCAALHPWLQARTNERVSRGAGALTLPSPSGRGCEEHLPREHTEGTEGKQGFDGGIGRRGLLLSMLEIGGREGWAGARDWG